MINTWFKFEDKIQNTSKVIMFTRNHTDNEDGTKNNMLPPVGGGDIITAFTSVNIKMNCISSAAFYQNPKLEAISYRFICNKFQISPMI